MNATKRTKNDKPIKEILKEMKSPCDDCFNKRNCQLFTPEVDVPRLNEVGLRKMPANCPVRHLAKRTYGWAE